MTGTGQLRLRRQRLSSKRSAHLLLIVWPASCVAPFTVQVLSKQSTKTTLFARSFVCCGCRNQLVQNTWEVELHGLHVHEAIEKTDMTYRVLKDLPCEPASPVTASHMLVALPKTLA